MKKSVLVGGICFLLGAVGLALAQTAMRPDQFVAAAWTWTGLQTFADGKLSLAGASSGNSIVKAPATGGGTVTLPTGSGTLGFSGGAVGALTLISTQTASGATNNVAWTALAAYKWLQLYCQMTVAANDNLKIQFSTAGTFQTANYTTSQYGGSAFSGYGGTSNSIGNGIYANGGNQANAAASQPIMLFAAISDITSTTTNKTVTGTSSYTNGNSTGQMEILIFGGDYRGSQAAVDGVKVLTNNAANMTGVCSLYGIAS